MGQEALHKEEVYAADGRLTNLDGRSALDKMSKGSFNLYGIIGVEGDEKTLSAGNSGTISRVKKDESLQELKSKSGKLDNINFVTS